MTKFLSNAWHMFFGSLSIVAWLMAVLFAAISDGKRGVQVYLR